MWGVGVKIGFKTGMTLSAILMAFSASSCSQPQVFEATENPLPVSFSEAETLQLRANSKSARQNFGRSFDALANDDVVHAEDLQTHHDGKRAEARAQAMTQLLKLDLNGDGQISPTEMLTINSGQIRNWASGSSKYIDFSKADLDEDEHLSLDEIFLFAAENPAPRSRFSGQDFTSYLNVFDLDRNSKITRQELTEGLNQFFEEDKAPPLTRPKPPLRKAQEPPKSCRPEAPQKSDLVVFLSGYEGSGLSSVSVVGMDDDTDVARLNIEKGKQPLYIIASSYEAMIWSIEGETSRVRRFVTAPRRGINGPGVGVTGLSKNKVSFLPEGCLRYFYGSENSNSVLALAKQKTLLDREPDKVLSAYTIAAMNVPSNIDNKPIPRKRDLNKKSFDLYRFSPEGLIMIDKSKVVAPAPVEDYDVYPQEAGLVQLVESGHLEPMERGAFRVVKPINRFPAGLAGAHSVKFIIAKGVPLPGGKPGHSTVYREDTGECLYGHQCRR